MIFIISLVDLLTTFSFSICKNSIVESQKFLDEGSSHGAIVPLTENTPQRSHQVRLNHTKGGKGKEGMVGSWKVELLDEIQRDFIKGGYGTLFNGVSRQVKG
jgi:hypothetical protein